jgi:hypothetical protein
MKVKIWYCMIDCGDGSCTRENFPTEAEAEACEAEQLEEADQYFEDAVGFEIFDTDGYEVVE